jgi:hypothetical protein
MGPIPSILWGLGVRIIFSDKFEQNMNNAGIRRSPNPTNLENLAPECPSEAPRFFHSHSSTPVLLGHSTADFLRSVAFGDLQAPALFIFCSKGTQEIKPVPLFPYHIHIL